jgi:hypothetical protein
MESFKAKRAPKMPADGSKRDETSGCAPASVRSRIQIWNSGQASGTLYPGGGSKSPLISEIL